MKKLSVFLSLTILPSLLMIAYSPPLYSGSAALDSENSLSIYYVRFDVRSLDNRVERSNLLIVPAESEFREAKFTSFVISGSADYLATGIKGVDIQTRAAHNAIKNFLEANGLESVKSQSTTVRGLAHDKSGGQGQSMVNDQTVVSFEGAVRLPYKILKSNFNGETGIYSVTLELTFAPLAFPDRWENMLFNHQIKMLFDQLKSFF